MTVTTTTNKVIGAGNGVATSFPFTFATLPEGNLVVTLIDANGVETVQTEGADYTVLGEGSDDGGAVVFTVAPPNGTTVLIERIVPLTQPTDYKNQGSFYPRTHERSFDRLTMIAQQLSEENQRTIKIPAHVTGVSTELPAPVAGGLLGWDAEGDALRYYPASPTGPHDAALINYTPPSTGVAGTVKSFLNSLWSTGTNAGAALIRFIQAGTGAVARTVQNKQREVFSVKDFGAVGDGVTDDTAAINAALSAAAAAVQRAVFMPAGTYLVSNMLSVPSGITLYGAGWNTVIKCKDNASAVAIVGLSSFSHLRDLYIDGNAANQTSHTYAVLGWRVEHARVTNVKVYNNYGIGVGWSESADCVCTSVIVDGCKNNAPGFWNGLGTVGSFWMDGRHRYIDCVSINNHLDGIIIDTPNCTIIGGRYCKNGYGGNYGGALGSAGIYTQDGVVHEGLMIIGADCSDNSEFGISVSVDNAVIMGNTCNRNQLSGIVLKDGAGINCVGNTCNENGWYTGTANPNVWVRAGIAIYTGVNHSVVANNTCVDRRGASATQEYGIRFANDARTDTSVGLKFYGNICDTNKIAPDNFNPAQPPSRLTNYYYYDLDPPSNAALTVSANNPNVSNARNVFTVGTFTLTNMTTGQRDGQVVTVFVTSGVLTINNTGNINLGSGTSISMGGFMANITFLYRGGEWWEVCRTAY